MKIRAHRLKSRTLPEEHGTNSTPLPITDLRSTHRLAGYLFRKRWTLIAIVILVPLGLYTKVYSGPAGEWVNNSLGGLLYVVFWSLVFCFLLPKFKPGRVAVSVFLATCLLEVIQLWHPAFLESIRSTFLGATLIGNSYSWLDMIHYTIGLAISVLLLRLLSVTE